MGYHVGHVVDLGVFDGVQCFGNGTDLVQFNQYGVTGFHFDTLFKSLFVSDIQVVSNDLDSVSQACFHFGKGFPVFFVEGVFDGDDGVFFNQHLVVIQQFIGSHVFAVNVISLVFSVVEFACGTIHGDEDLFSWFVTGLFDGLDNHRNSLFVGTQIGANPPSSPTDVMLPSAFNMDFILWKISAPALRASLKQQNPAGMIMNSWISKLLSACCPPLMIFIMGTGMVLAFAPPRY